ncbi:hypothetical protein [Oecophyllibacter saccharovorans]|uniref:Uncharacterized protein n=1 Tax=Oecophyllibacter saccharovorans TaxID=2558360 RepID=A0A506ULT3_9PROT|nr:hypothetical protein [Oecophyllibacter saccharovorans]TPW34143.1 hypothetical protein E3202_06350 [Oecophyllibacter saccharovorans]
MPPNLPPLAGPQNTGPRSNGSGNRPAGSAPQDRLICRTQPDPAVTGLKLHQRPAAASWKALQNIVQELGLKGFAFARPLPATSEPAAGSPDPDRMPLDWFGPQGPDPLPFSSLPAERRQLVEKRLRLCLPALRSAARSKGPECAALMDLALQVPDLDSLWIIGEGIVLAPWGMRRTEQAASSRASAALPVALSPLGPFLGLEPGKSPAEGDNRRKPRSSAADQPRRAESGPAEAGAAPPQHRLRPFFIPAGVELWLSVVLCVLTGLLFFGLAFRAVLLLGWGSLWPVALF